MNYENNNENGGGVVTPSHNKDLEGAEEAQPNGPVAYAVTDWDKDANGTNQEKDPNETEKEAGSESSFGDPTTRPSQNKFVRSLSDERGNLKFVNVVVRHPCKIFCSLLVLCLVITFGLLAILFQGGNPITEPENEFDLNDKRSIQYDSLRLAQEVVEDIRQGEITTPVKQQSEQADLTYWVFEGQRPEGVFGSAEAIAAMKEAFDIFLEDEGFEEFCLLKYDEDGGATCDVPLTPLASYYASEWDSERAAVVIDQLRNETQRELFNSLALCYTRGVLCQQVPSSVTNSTIEWALALNENITAISSTWDMKGESLVENFTQVTELASYLKLVDIYRGLVDFGYDKRFSVDNPYSKYSRGILWWGGPLTNRANLTKEQKENQDDEDEEDRKDYILDNYLDQMDDQASKGEHEEINSYYFMGVLLLDVILRIVQRDAMLAIFSLVFVFLWIRINTGSWFLAGVGIFEIFISIPISWFFFSYVFQIKYFATLNTLCIFIVAAIGADDIFIFMDAYRQSQHRNPENLVDMETRMTWVYRRTGTAMAITSATTCAAFLCTLITPLTSIQSFGIFAAFVIFFDYVLVMTLFCTAVVIYHDRYEQRGCFGCCCTDCSKTDPSPTEKAHETLESGQDDDAKGDVVSEFFRNQVAGFILVPWHRLVLAVFFLTWIALAAWQASKIEPVREAEQFLDEDHPLQKSITILNNEFPTADDDAGLKVYFAWGLGKVDRSGVNLLLDPEDFGEPTFLDTFEFNEQCQTELVRLCDQFRTDRQYADLIKRKGGVGVVYCFMEELAVYALRGDLADCNYVEGGAWKNEDWQIPPSELGTYMDGFLQQQSCYSDDAETISSRYSNEIGWDGRTMRYAAVAVEDEVLNPFSQEAEQTTRDQYDQYARIAEEVDQVVSQYCSGPVVMTDLDQKFVFMNNQAIFVQTAVQSSILGAAIAFVVLLISTRVLHIAFFASVSIVCVLVSVVGTMVMLGWSLGSIESILIGIIAGFSVDYVVHLAHAYETARGDTAERVQAAFGDMGISVLNGMITSVGASIPLFFCQLTFFAKFGTFLCLTIAFSWIFANFAFMSILAQFKIPIKHHGCRL